jgi:hypothetical protein
MINDALFRRDRVSHKHTFYRSPTMSKLAAFYQKAHTDEALKAEIAALTAGYVSGVIAVAAKHGHTLIPADFAPPTATLDDEALADVSGGALPRGRFGKIIF